MRDTTRRCSLRFLAISGLFAFGISIRGIGSRREGNAISKKQWSSRVQKGLTEFAKPSELHFVPFSEKSYELLKHGATIPIRRWDGFDQLLKLSRNFVR